MAIMATGQVCDFYTGIRHNKLFVKRPGRRKSFRRNFEVSRVGLVIDRMLIRTCITLYRNRTPFGMEMNVCVRMFELMHVMT